MILHATESGQGPPLALLHGLFGSGANFGAVQRRLSARFRVLALDLRNHGASPHGSITSYDDLAQDVLATLANGAALPAALVGHSMGGKVAMRTALLRPNAVLKLVVADIAPVPYAPTFRAYTDAMLAVPLTPGLTRAQADQALAHAVPDSSIRAFLLQNLRFEAVPSWRNGLVEIAQALPVLEHWADLPDARYDGPALFVAGGRSDYIRMEHRPVIRRLFPRARFVTIKQTGHWIHAEAPGAFTETLEAFLG